MKIVCVDAGSPCQDNENVWLCCARIKTIWGVELYQGWHRGHTDTPGRISAAGAGFDDFTVSSDAGTERSIPDHPELPKFCFKGDMASHL